MNFDAVNKEAETVKEVTKVEPPDVFSIISASNRGNKMPIHEGDIAISTSHGRSAIKCDRDTCRWPKNSTGMVNVPYTIAPSFNGDSVSIITAAMQEFATLSCVRFVPRTSEKDYVEIIKSMGCWSYIGRQRGAQQLSLDTSCVARGTIQHELNHALGFYHEQSRSDRDNYVAILSENILPETASNFQKYDSNNLGLEYDYSSVMHYGKFAFSVSSSLQTIVPKPDSSVAIGQRYGLSSLDVAKVNKLYNCGLCRGLLSNTTGSIISSNYPNNYPSDTNCLWLIRIPWGQVFLEFSAFDIQSSPNCASDYLRIYDGPSRSSPLLLDRACGSGQLPPMVASGSTMLVEFISDSQTQATGFKTSYSTVTCGGMLTSRTGNISSPSYPSTYPPYSDCAWIITAPAGFVVSLNFIDFYLEVSSTCSKDHLLVLDGPKITSTQLGKFCGKGIAMPNIMSSGNSLLLKFKSDRSLQLPGFFAKYSFVPKK
ncbi:embryonic protein UVS.2-like [Engystomops pustulosus]|uniref:embryonic protein UVS.2-like n=1 Tax=Engystomops pustulosus TaxID=76066 RepID=UPI003AFA3705